MRPVPEEVPDVGAHRLARRADEGGRDVQDVEGLVPDLDQPVGLGEARPDAGVHEVEEEQAGDALGVSARHRLHDAAADVVADDAGLFHPERVEHRQHVGGVLRVAPRAVRLVAVAEAAQVRRDQRVAVGEAVHHRLPGEGKLRPAVEQEQRRPLPHARDVEGGALRLDGQMFHGVWSGGRGHGGNPALDAGATARAHGRSGTVGTPKERHA